MVSHARDTVPTVWAERASFSVAALEKEYRRLSRLHHPDKSWNKTRGDARDGDPEPWARGAARRAEAGRVRQRDGSGGGDDDCRGDDDAAAATAESCANLRAQLKEMQRRDKERQDAKREVRTARRRVTRRRCLSGVVTEGQDKAGEE